MPLCKEKFDSYETIVILDWSLEFDNLMHPFMFVKWNVLFSFVLKTHNVTTWFHIITVYIHIYLWRMSITEKNFL